MNIQASTRRSVTAYAMCGALNPIPFGSFVAALIFDLIYSCAAGVLWAKGAAGGIARRCARQ